MNNTGTVFGTCSLCLVEGGVKSMLPQNTEATESYTNMLLNCFSIDMAAMEITDTHKLICNLCIKQLQICIEFKEQVTASLKSLEENLRMLVGAAKDEIQDCAIIEDNISGKITPVLQTISNETTAAVPNYRIIENELCNQGGMESSNIQLKPEKIYGCTSCIDEFWTEKEYNNHMCLLLRDEVEQREVGPSQTREPEADTTNKNKPCGNKLVVRLAMHADDAPGDHHLPVDDEDWSHHASGDKFPSVTGNDWSHQASGDRSPPVPDENRSPLGVEYGSHQGSGDDSQPVTAAEPTHHASRGEVPPVVETTTHASCHVYESLPAANANLTYHTTGFDANRVCRVILKKCDSEIRLRDTNVCIPIQSNYNSRSSKKTFSSSSSNKCVKESQNNVKSHALLCDLCGFECKRKNTLLRHILAHFGSKSYSLRYRRMRSHAGETSYYCNECNYKAKVKSHLDRHKRCHSNERPYSCKLCNFKSKRSDNLKKHVETHYAVKKPHACSFCDYACVYKKIMQRHMTKAHPKLHVSLSRVQSHVTTSYPTGHKKVNAATKCNSPVY